jgi:putative transposase
MERARGAFEAQVVAMYLRGVSTRHVGELLDGLVGVSVSAGRVSELARKLDVEVSAFHRRALEDRYAYLFLDGVWLKSRNVPSLLRRLPEARKRVALVAYGVTHAGQKELIDFRLEKAESEAAWARFLTGLVRRGLSGDTLRLVCTDGGTGLLSALDLVYPQVPRQRCWFHKVSNVLRKVRHRHRKECLGGLRAVYTAESRPAGERAYAAWAKRWAEVEPAAVCCVERDLDDLLTFFAFPREHWRMLRTTNAIERRFRELRRRTRSVGCFMNNASIERMIYGLFTYHNRRWAGRVCREFRGAPCGAA